MSWLDDAPGSGYGYLPTWQERLRWHREAEPRTTHDAYSRIDDIDYWYEYLREINDAQK